MMLMSNTTPLDTALDSLTTAEYLDLSAWLREHAAEAKAMTQAELDAAVAARVEHTLAWRGAE